jgi:hypothetical protein
MRINMFSECADICRRTQNNGKCIAQLARDLALSVEFEMFDERVKELVDKVLEVTEDR